MRQIRKKCFETNSSSMHSVTIIPSNESQKGYLTVDNEDGYVHVEFDEFGWGVDTYTDAYTKLSYLLTLFASNLPEVDIDPWERLTEEEYEEKIRIPVCKEDTFLDIEDAVKRHLEGEGKECKGIYIDTSTGYIDHQSMQSVENFIYEYNISSIEDFIFSQKYKLVIDNDNH